MVPRYSMDNTWSHHGNSRQLDFRIYYNAYFEVFGHHSCILEKIRVQGKGIKRKKLVIKESKMRSIVCDYTNKKTRLPEHLI